MKGPWIKFAEVDLKDGRKTKVWAVLTLDGRTCLGRVGWYPAWRRYVYAPHKDTLYEQDCLRLIATFCEGKTADRKRERMQVPK